MVAPRPWCLGRSRRRPPSPLLPSRVGRGGVAKVRHPFQRLPGATEKGPGKSPPDGVPPLLRVGGCLSAHWRHWQAIGTESWVLSVLRDGYPSPSRNLLLPSLASRYRFRRIGQDFLGHWPCARRSRRCCPRMLWRSSSIRVPASTVVTHHMVQEVHKWLVLLHSRRRIQVHFCWVPAHVGVIGNERADQAAKEAMRMLYPSLISIPYRDFRSAIHFYIKDKWQASWSSLTDNLKLKSIHPSIEKWQSLGITGRRTSILLTRMRIGHTHATHSYLMKSGDERQAPLCNSCRVGLTIEHILTACPAFDSERRAASLHGRSMSEVLGNDCSIGGLMLFLRNTGFYHKF